MSALHRFAVQFSDFLNLHIFRFNKMSPMFAINGLQELNSMSNRSNNSLIDDLMSDPFVWAVPKKRRTVENRLVRRFGVERYPQNSHMIRPKEDIIVCDNCGHYHEWHTICPNCYKKVRLESNLLIQEIRKRFNYSEPIEEEVHFRYDNDSKDDNEVNGKRIVEIERQRPEWFAKNLLSRSVGNKWIETNPVVKEEEPKVIIKD